MKAFLMEQHFFLNSNPEYFFFLLICLHLHSSSVYTLKTLSITEKVMLNIKPIASLVATNIIFDRNTGGKK